MSVKPLLVRIFRQAFRLTLIYLRFGPLALIGEPRSRARCITIQLQCHRTCRCNMITC